MFWMELIASKKQQMVVKKMIKKRITLKLNSDDDLPLNKPLKFHAKTIIFKSVLEEGGKLYPQVFLDE